MAEEFSTAELARALDKVSDDIKREVGLLIPPAADRMVGLLERRYPVGRASHPNVPHMRDDIRVRTLLTNSHLLPGRKVMGPRLAYIWQNGTKVREYVNRKGTTHRTGAAKAQDRGFFERTAVQTRAEMMARAQALLDRPHEIR